MKTLTLVDSNSVRLEELVWRRQSDAFSTRFGKGQVLICRRSTGKAEDEYILCETKADVCTLLADQMAEALKWFTCRVSDIKAGHFRVATAV